MKTLKKILAVVLAAATLLGCAAGISVSAQTNEPLHIALCSDIHTDVTPEKIEVINDSLYSNSHTTGNMIDEAYAILSAFLKDAQEKNVSSILISGDLCNNGLKVQADMLSKFLADFEDSSGIPIYVVPGNHDGYTEMTRDDFKRTYARFGLDEAIAKDDATCSYVVDLDDNYRLLAIDSINWGVTKDGITDELIEWIVAQANQARADGKKPIAMMHHPLIEHYQLQKEIFYAFVVQNWRKLASTFADCGIQYVFTGHEHGSDIASYTSAAGNTVYDIMTTSLNCRPIGYRDITFSDTGVEVKSALLDSVDPDYLADGYTDEQIAALTGDLQNYAFGYTDKCFETVVKNYLDPDVLCELIGMESGIIADVIHSVTPKAEKALFMPLYGEKDSFEALAKSYNTTLPASDYATLWDVAMSVLHIHYVGDENLPSTSPEITLIVKGLNVALEYALNGIPDGIRDKLFGAIFNALGIDAEQLEAGLRGKVTGAIGSGDSNYKIAMALLGSVLDEVTIDGGIADNDVTLPAYAELKPADTLAAISFTFTNILRYILKAMLTVTKMFSAIIEKIH